VLALPDATEGSLKENQTEQPRTYRAYAVLAVMNLVTIVAALALTAHMTESHRRSVSGSREWAARVSSFGRLFDLAGKVDTSAHEVFASGSIEAASASLEMNLRAFNTAMARARGDVAGNEDVAESAPLTRELARTNAALQEMAIISRGVLAAVRDGEREKAASMLVAADRKLSAVRSQIVTLIDTAGRVQEERFRQQERRNAIVSALEQVLAVAILALVITITFYTRRAARDLRNTEDRARRFDGMRRLIDAFENAIDGIAFIDTNNRYSFVNFAYASAAGSTTNDLLGQSWEESIHPDDRAEWARARAEVDTWGRAERELRGLRVDGTSFHQRVVLVAAEDGGPELALYCFMRDVTEEKHAADTLRRSEERFELASRATADVIWDWNIASGTLWLNGALTTQYGHDSGEVPVSIWSGNVHPADHDRVMSEIDEVIAAGNSVWTGEYRFRRADGTWAEVFDRGYVVYDSEGSATRMIGAMLDMTARNAAQREINELSRRNNLILKSAADGIFGLDVNGYTTFVNDAASTMLGWPVDELRRVRMHDVVHNVDESDGQDWESCPACLPVRSGQSVISSAEVFHRRDGSAMPVEYTTSPIRNEEGRVVGGVVTFRDITERRAVERMKDEFVSVVSHELRTPLTSIRGALGLIASGHVSAGSDKGQRMIDIAVSNTDRLIRLINDILDIERMESGQITLSKSLCNVPDLVAQAVEVMRPMAEKARIRVVSHAERCSIVADGDRIVQTLTNLISNAIKFSPPDTTITVTALEGAGRVEFEVGDQGRGIPAEKLELIFERFQQIDASDSRQKGGSGLGLAICRSIVRQHGGDILAESTPGAGSRFRFHVAAPENGYETAAIDLRPSVLICDDDELIVEAAAAIVEARGYRAIGVTSGRDLIDQAAIVSPDVILLDLFMPNLNGWETLGALKQNPETAQIPVIILSVLAPEDTGTPAFQVAGWIQKPLESENFVQTLDRVIADEPRGRVLVIEHDQDLADVMTQVLRRRGIRTFHAATGRQAIQMAPHVRPNVVVLDVVAPDVDGFNVVASLKDQEQIRSVPMIVYSAFEPNAAQREKLRLGPTEFLTKSRVTPDEVERRVVDLLHTLVLKKGEFSNVA
jgi:PAS domain S-box-containing protein